MIDFRNKVFTGAEGRESVFDAQISLENRAVIIFAHGYKGYKDWGCWNIMQEWFTEKKFGFVKFNFSHNGGTVADPIDFPDLDAFGKNTYSFELKDLGIVIDETERLLRQELEMTVPIYLIGHSRGGGVAILKASKDSRIGKVISLAGISDIGMRFPEGEELEDWKIAGVRYIENVRTKQYMPHYYSFYEDFERNKETLKIQSAAESLSIPFLQVHGDMDLAVSISEGQRIAKWTNTRVAIVKGAGHTFSATQPWEKKELPSDFQTVLQVCLEFFEG